MRPNDRLSVLLQAAYQPCDHFGICSEAKWDPAIGHIPRGFLGAMGELEDVEVVMVFAEPGHPNPAEGYDPAASPINLLESGALRTYHAFASGLDLFHRNVRWFMSQLYPELTFEQQLQHVWLTEGRLCSINNEIGSTRDHRCAQHYLRAQLQMLPNATVVAFGGKAQDYVGSLGVEHLKTYALSPPGCNRRTAKPSWGGAIKQIEHRRAQRSGARPEDHVEPRKGASRSAWDGRSRPRRDQALPFRVSHRPEIDALKSAAKGLPTSNTSIAAIMHLSYSSPTKTVTAKQGQPHQEFAGKPGLNAMRAAIQAAAEVNAHDAEIIRALEALGTAIEG